MTQENEAELKIRYSLSLEDIIFNLGRNWEISEDELPFYLQWIKEDIRNTVDEGHFDSYESLTERAREFQFKWVHQGVICNYIKKRELWAKTHKTWGAWCKENLFRTHNSVQLLIEAATVFVRLFDFGFTDLPTNPSQAYELRKLDDDALIATWSQVISDHPTYKRSASIIRDYTVGTEYETKPRERIQASGEIGFALAERSAKKGMSQSAYIRHLVALEESIDAQRKEVPLDQLRDWEEDLEQVVSQSPAFEQEREEVKEELVKPLPPQPLVTSILSYLESAFNELINCFAPEVLEQPVQPDQLDEVLEEEVDLKLIARAVEFCIGQFRENATLKIISTEIADYLPELGRRSTIEKKIPQAIRRFTVAQGLRELRDYILSAGNSYPMPSCPW